MTPEALAGGMTKFGGPAACAPVLGVGVGVPANAPMQKFDFTKAVEEIVSRDPRFDREAYVFLHEALDFTVKQGSKMGPPRTPHVSGQQLLEGIRLYALKQFGPMVPTVFGYWGVTRCEHFGQMVYNLIHAGVFGRSETDSIEDFKNGYSFEEAFVTPFLPQTPPKPRRGSRREVRNP
ncbi:MAG: hypothetical protein RLZZ142_2865 [Verrucomicrobiota bacterium]